MSIDYFSSQPAILLQCWVLTVGGDRAGTLKCLSCRRTVPSSKTDPNDGPALCEDCAAEVQAPFILCLHLFHLFFLGLPRDVVRIAGGMDCIMTLSLPCSTAAQQMLLTLPLPGRSAA